MAVPLRGKGCQGGKRGETQEHSQEWLCHSERAGCACSLEEGAACAGPLPVLRPRDESGTHGIPFDVMADARKFSGIPDPMIERFVLPEGLARAAKSSIGIAGSHAFDDAGDFGKRQTRLQQDVNVVGHDHVGVQQVAAEFGTMNDGVFGIGGDFRVSQPKWAGLGGVEGGIELAEFLSRSLLGAKMWSFGGTAIPGCAGSFQ